VDEPPSLIDFDPQKIALWVGGVMFFYIQKMSEGGFLVLLFTIFMNGGIPYVLLYAVCLLTIECAIAYGIEPKMLGHGLQLSTMVIILSLFFWGFLLGAIGLFLAAPLTVMIKIILQAFPETRWLAVFLEGGGGEKQH
jgi:predicted PurR-regulated permease PerM